MKNEKISKSLKKYYKENPKQKKIHINICEKCGNKFEGYIRKNRKKHCKNCKRKVVHKKEINEATTLFDFSKRTISKILNRMDIGCSICGWNKTICDIHHIIERKNGGTDDHSNLTYVCPNCHRMIHNNLLNPKMNLLEQIGDSWKDYYGISNC